MEQKMASDWVTTNKLRWKNFLLLLKLKIIPLFTTYYNLPSGLMQHYE